MCWMSLRAAAHGFPHRPSSRADKLEATILPRGNSGKEARARPEGWVSPHLAEGTRPAPSQHCRLQLCFLHPHPPPPRDLPAVNHQGLPCTPPPPPPPSPVSPHKAPISEIRKGSPYITIFFFFCLSISCFSLLLFFCLFLCSPPCLSLPICGLMEEVEEARSSRRGQNSSHSCFRLISHVQ